MELRTHQGGQPPAHEGGGRTLPPGRASLPHGSHVAPSTYSSTHTLCFPPEKNHPVAQTRVLAHLAAIFDLFAQSSIHKTVLGRLFFGM